MQVFLTAMSPAGDMSGKEGLDPAEARRNSAEAFISNNAYSMYCEFVDHFRKK